MKTVVYQSFRTSDVPPWVEICMQSAKAWAEQKGYNYKFWDDRFFDFVPPTLQNRASVHNSLLSDYARLSAAKELFRNGWDRAVWIDADTLIFEPDLFDIATRSGYTFCREVWLDRIVWQRPQFKLTVNNSVSVFCRDESLIDFYLDAAGALLRSDQPLTPCSIGTDWLRELRRLVEFPLLSTVGTFGPEMAFSYLRNDGRLLRPYLSYQTSRIAAVNLCLSKRGQTCRFKGSEPWTFDDAATREIVGRLLDDRGASLNSWFAPSYTPPRNELERPLSRYLAITGAFKSLLHASLGTNML